MTDKPEDVDPERTQIVMDRVADKLSEFEGEGIVVVLEGTDPLDSEPGDDDYEEDILHYEVRAEQAVAATISEHDFDIDSIMAALVPEPGHTEEMVAERYTVDERSESDE